MNEIEKVCFDYYQKNNKKDLEFEVRFGKRAEPILKNDVDNVIQKFSHADLRFLVVMNM